MSNKNRPFLSLFPRLLSRAGLALFFVAGAGIAGAEQVVHELTLADCVELALQNNLDLRLERVSHESARTDISAAQGGYDPALTASATRRHEETLGRADRDTPRTGQRRQ